MRPKAILVTSVLVALMVLVTVGAPNPDQGRVIALSTGTPVLKHFTTVTTPTVNAPDLNAVLAKVVWERSVAQTEWDAAIARNNARAAAQNAAQKKAARPRTRSGPATYGSGACGGDLPPCSVMMCESGGSLTAQNPRSTASGKWQILSSTWNGYGGYSNASDAPESVQDARAREIYAGGAGRSAWVC